MNVHVYDDMLFVLIRLKILDNAVRTCLVSQTSDDYLYKVVGSVATSQQILVRF